MTMSHRGEEDYLKALYKKTYQYNQGDTLRVGNKELCNYFGHTIQTVNEMIKRLCTKGYVDYVPYKGSKLTDKGLQRVVVLINRHRLWEVFLVNCCGYTWEEVDEEAEQLEHVTSSRLSNALYRFLNEPEKCPHGDWITKDGEWIYPVKDNQLSGVNEGEVVTVSRVVDDKDTLLELTHHDINIGDQLTLVRYQDNDLIIENGASEPIRLKKEYAEKMYVRIIPNIKET